MLQVATQQGKYLGHLFGQFEVNPGKDGNLCLNTTYYFV